jgi:hypothetical protein
MAASLGRKSPSSARLHLRSGVRHFASICIWGLCGNFGASNLRNEDWAASRQRHLLSSVFFTFQFAITASRAHSCSDFVARGTSQLRASLAVVVAACELRPAA